MSTRIAFLRAVNLGKRRVENTRLVEIFEGLGYEDVWAYIASGNVVFGASGSRAAIEKTIEHALEEAYGFEVTTFVRTPGEVAKALALEPFSTADGDTYFVTFLKKAPSADIARSLEAASNDYDTLVVDGRDVHWLMHGSSIDTKVTKKTWNLVGELGSTSRNTTMLRRLLAKIDG